MLVGQLEIGKKYNYKLGLQENYEEVEVIEIDVEPKIKYLRRISMVLPTMEDCLHIVNNSEAFYIVETEEEGYSVRLLNYRLASISDYVNNNAFELRGLCYIKDDKGTWHRNILMNKFFNLNETKLDRYSWMLEDVQDKKIQRIQEKLDGSVISFCRFPNSNIRAKSKMSFNSEQAIMAQGIFDSNINYQNFIVYCLEIEKLVPIFELISPQNQVVLSYNNTELKLLQIRDSFTGRYLTKEEMFERASNFDIPLAEDYESSGYMTFEELLEKQKTLENIEGWVVTLEDGQMLKIKTEWYHAMHGLTTNNTRENLLVQTILEDRIDDVISLIPDGEKKEFMIATVEKVQHKFNHLVVEYKDLRGQYFNKFQEDRKEFAKNYSKHELFGYVMKGLGTSFREVEQIAEKHVKDYISNKTKKLGDAREFLASI